MKKLSLMIVMAFLCQIVFSQVTPQVKTAPVTSVRLTPIASTKATVIRKDTKTLQLQVTQLNDSVSILKRQMDVLMNSLKDQKDSLGEMTEAEQLKLQQAMERMNSIIQMISNMIKKMHDTDSAIVSNLKG